MIHGCLKEVYRTVGEIGMQIHRYNTRSYKSLQIIVYRDFSCIIHLIKYLNNKQYKAVINPLKLFVKV